MYFAQRFPLPQAQDLQRKAERPVKTTVTASIEHAVEFGKHFKKW
jgi:hypothetical protein